MSSPPLATNDAVQGEAPLPRPWAEHHRAPALIVNKHGGLGLQRWNSEQLKLGMNNCCLLLVRRDRPETV